MIKQIKETCLYVQNLEKTKRFYGEVLELPLISSAENRHVFFRAGSSVLLCFNPDMTRRDQELPPHYASGKMHLAFEVSPEDYEQWKQKLTDRGIVITHEKTWREGLNSFYFEDPDGHVLEIICEGVWG
jgi:catechol 2,3-dioxygenase-like lactoylglutathione lyase family enzyme